MQATYAAMRRPTGSSVPQLIAAEARMVGTKSHAYDDAGVGLDPSMAAMQLRRGLLTPAWLQTVAAALDVHPVRTVVIGANELPLNVRRSA